MVKEILEKASQRGIDLIDTASTYGDSEKILGDKMRKNQFKIITKLAGKGNSAWTKEAIIELEKILKTNP